MRRFEDRHRELRAAVMAARSRCLGLSDEHTAAAMDAIDEFESRTGSLVDDLAAAVREVSTAWDTMGALAKAVDALAALDEASGVG